MQCVESRLQPFAALLPEDLEPVTAFSVGLAAQALCDALSTRTPDQVGRAISKLIPGAGILFQVGGALRVRSDCFKS